MNRWLPVTVAFVAFACQAADPKEVWEQAITAKGGHQRLRAIHSLAVYMKPADVMLSGPPSTWLFVFPNRYFEFDGRGSWPHPYMAPNGAIRMADSPRAIIVDGSTDRIAMDANGMPRAKWRLTSIEHDRLTLNQLIFLLETAWLQPEPVAVRRNILVVTAGGRTYQLHLNNSNLPERVFSPPNSGEKSKLKYDYRLQRYRGFQGVMLPARVVWISGTREWTWDVDYEVDARYNPKLFEREPDLGDGPEPWRR